MSGSTPGGASHVSDHEVGGHFPRGTELSSEDYAALRAEYGRFRAWAKTNPERFRTLQRALSQARMGTTYDVYLARCVKLGLLGGALGMLLGSILAVVLVTAGVFDGLQSPFDVGGALAAALRANKVVLAGGLSALFVSILAGSGVFLASYHYPRMRAARRRQRITFLLPHAIVYMYALSHGGTNLVGVVDRLADSSDVYDEVAEEFDAIRRDVELFGSDLTTALQNRRNITPSPTLERFLDDLVSVLDTGGDVTAFLESSTQTYLEDAEEEQESFLNTMAVYSEIYIAAFVAAPLFVVVILIVISFLGGETLGLMGALIYVAFPLGMALFLALLVVLTSAYRYPETELTLPELGPTSPVTASELADDSRFGRYRAGPWQRLRRLAGSPVDTLRAEPTWAVAVTAPLALALVAVLVLTGAATPADMRTAPISTTSLLVVYPFLVLVAPVALFYELKRSRESAIRDRLPAALNVLSSANRMGIPFPESLDLLSRYTKGVLAREFRLTRNDLFWSNDLQRSLLSMANRLDVPQVSRTVKLVADGARSSGDLARILSIAAADARDRQRLLNRRRNEMSIYLGIVVIGFLVYLMVVVFLDLGFLQPIEDIAAESEPDTRAPVSVADLPADTYRMLLFHSVLIQAVGTGLIAGKLSADSILSGLKYAVGLVVVTLIVFALI